MKNCERCGRDGFFIPKKLTQYFEAGLISPSELLLLYFIYLEHDDDLGGCGLTNSQFSKRLHLSERNIRTHINNLKQLELIDTVSFDGRVRILAMLK